MNNLDLFESSKKPCYGPGCYSSESERGGPGSMPG